MSPFGPTRQPVRISAAPRDSYILSVVQSLLFGLRGRVELDLMQPSIVNKILHIPISWHFEPNLPPRRKAIVRVILVILVTIAIFPDTLSVEPLILELLSHVAQVVDNFGVLEAFQ